MSDDRKPDHVAQDAVEDLELDGETAEAVGGGDKSEPVTRIGPHSGKLGKAPPPSGPVPIPYPI
jgi:hypothetical protein